MTKSAEASQRMAEITPFIVMEVLEAAHAMERQGADIIHLEIGEPDFDTPECVKQAAVRAAKDGKNHYTHSLGIIELRQALSRYYRKRYGVEVEPDRFIITSGTSPAMFLLFSVLLNQGDEVIISDPHYACYPNFIRFAGGVPVRVPVFEDDGFQYRPEDVARKITSRTKAVFINSPSNPTGCLLDFERMKSIAGLPAHVVSDEIYHGLVYEGREHSILEFTDDAFVLNGFSKLFAMTGWRLGWLIAPRKFIRPLQILQQNFFICASSISQWAAIAALEEAGEDVERMRRIYDERRRFIVPRLRQMGFGITKEPTGAFYVLANAGKFCSDSYEFAFEILKRAHVGVTPGVDFGENARSYVRFSYANSLENIAEGLNRLEKYLLERKNVCR